MPATVDRADDAYAAGEDATTSFLDTEPGAAAPAECVHYLVPLHTHAPLQHIELRDRPVTFGRCPAADVRLPDKAVSKLHCRVALSGGHVLVTDLGSTNGTFIDGERCLGPRPLPIQARLQFGGYAFVHECRSRSELEETSEIAADLQRAREYVESLLPRPIADGAITADWCYRPSAVLGGDAFGYFDVSPDRFVLFLLDVSGHGTGPALHSVSVVNILHSRALADADLADPSQVLRGLNRVFQMSDHDDLYFTMWYGVFDRRLRRLRYVSAAHPPAFLLSPDGQSVRRLQTKNAAVGLFPEVDYASAEIDVPAGSSLYVLSDGAFETLTPQGDELQADGIESLLTRLRLSGQGQSARIGRELARMAGRESFDDDLSILTVRFA